MKVIKGNFSENNKAPGKNQKAPVIYDEDGNYSVMLLDLIKPYLNTIPTKEDLEDKLNLGIVAWNLAIPKSLSIPRYNEALKNVAAEEGFNKDQVALIKKIEKDKQEKYPEHTSFIEKYKLKEDINNQMDVVLTCIPLSDLSAKDFDIDFEDFDDEDFADDDDFLEMDQYEEGIIDRSAFSLKRKSAFLEWSKKSNNVVDAGGNVIYLIDEKESEKDANGWLKKNFQKLMSGELAEVTKDKQKWPKLSYKVFCDFFEIQFHEMIWDTEEKPVKKY